MMMYGHVYVAQISLGAQLNQTVKAIQEAEAYPRLPCSPNLVTAPSGVAFDAWPPVLE
jgi:pyruvate/2-oxoacid:ferredoxin oxidoreductase beta subunit